MRKIQASVNQRQIELDTVEATKNTLKINKALDSIKLITEGGINEYDKEALESYLNERTGFRNPLLSADALGYKDEYISVMNAPDLNALDYKIELIKDKYSFDENEIKEKHTVYLSENLIPIYKSLEDLAKQINKVDPYYRECIGYTSKGAEASPGALQRKAQFKKLGM